MKLVTGFAVILACKGNATRSPDMRLLSLVPPGSQIVAGMSAPSNESSPTNFFLMAPANRTDFADFAAIVDADPSRVIDQVIFTDSPSPSAVAAEHSLLVSGRFDANRILHNANINEVTDAKDGVRIAVVKPFDRERSSFNEQRLLGIIDSRYILFGTAASVEQEIGRYLNGSRPDISIIERLQRLQRGADSWSLLSPVRFSPYLREVLSQLAPELGSVGEHGCAFEFGMRYGWFRVEVEYSFSSVCVSDSENQAETATERVLLGPRAGWSFAPAVAGTGEYGGKIKVSRARYDEWIQNSHCGSQLLSANPD
jgi:hypothetical protein